MVSPRNYFLYTPLLPGAATGTVEPRSIVDCVRGYVGKPITFYEAECNDVDPAAQRISCRYSKTFRGCMGKAVEDREFQLDYDILVFAVGSVSNTFNTPGVEENCYFLKTVEDAKALRQRVNECFEIASLPATTPEERKQLLSFVVVGGGPTGVELAAEMHDLVREDMPRFFPRIPREDVSISIVHTRDSILNCFDRGIAAYATEHFAREGINLILNCRTESVIPGAVLIRERGATEMRAVPFGTCCWSTGIRMHPLAENLIAKLPEGSQQNWKSLRVDNYMRVQGTRGTIFAIGDAATITQEKALEHAAYLFEMGDTNKDNLLTCEELAVLMKKAKREYPHLAEHANRFHCSRVPASVVEFVRNVVRAQTASSYDFVAAASFATDVDKSHVMDTVHKEEEHACVVPKEGMTLEQFTNQLQYIDRGLRSVPATAQAAHQEGHYLGHLFRTYHPQPNPAHGNTVELPEEAPPFHYRNLGSLAYIGGDAAVIDPAVQGSRLGWVRGWLMGFAWKGAEVFMQNSYKNMYLVSRDLVKTKILGRDISDV